MYARNPDYLKQKNKSPYEGNINLRTLQKCNGYIDNILDGKSKDELNEVQQKMICTAVENIVYYADHVEFPDYLIGRKSFNRTIQKAIRNTSDIVPAKQIEQLKGLLPK